MDFTSTVEVKNFLLSQLHLTGDGTASQIFDSVWSLYSSLGFPELRVLYAKRELLDYLLGQYALKFNSKAYLVSLDEGQVFGHLMELRKLLDSTIKEMLNLFGSGSAVVGLLTTTVPESYTRMYLGPNSIIYRGLPSYQLPDGSDGSL